MDNWEKIEREVRKVVDTGVLPDGDHATISEWNWLIEIADAIRALRERDDKGWEIVTLARLDLIAWANEPHTIPAHECLRLADRLRVAREGRDA